MTIPPFQLRFSALVLLTLVAACGQTGLQLEQARAMSCTELARELGKREQKRESAQIDGFAHSLDSVFADDKKARREADMNSVLTSLDEAVAEKEIAQLEQIFTAKGCT